MTVNGSNVYWTVHHCNNWRMKDQLDVTCFFFFHFLCAQHVSDINISIIRSLRLCCRITTSVVLFSVRCVLEIWCGSACKTNATQNQPHQISNTQRTQNKTTDVVIQQHSRKLLMMDILMSETCWAHKKWKKKASDIKLVFYSSTTVNGLLLLLSENTGRFVVKFDTVIQMAAFVPGERQNW